MGAVLAGGFGGSWLAPGRGPLPLTHEACAPQAPRSAGRAGDAAQRGCGWPRPRGSLRYLAAESAGQCGRARSGCRRSPPTWTELAGGSDAAPAAMDRLRRRLGVIAGRGACAHPDGAVRLAASALRVFARDAAGHVRHGPCAAADDPPWLPVPEVDPAAGGGR